MTHRNCCCSTGCFYGHEVSSGGYCFHTKSERLEYRCPRPEYTFGELLQTYSQINGQPPCPCLNDVYLSQTMCPASPDIVCRYEHFNYTNPNETYVYYYKQPSDLLYPPCENVCCGFANDSICCASGGTSRSCSKRYRLFTGGKCSPFQEQVIKTGSVPTLQPSPAVGCDYGPSFKWLDGVANFRAPFGLQFNHYQLLNGAIVQTTKNHLVQTMAFLVFPTKWYMRGNTPGGGARVGFNSLSQTDNPAATATDNAAADNRTPKWWVYACTGQPVYTWEIYELSSLTTTEADEMIEAVAAGRPLNPNSMQKLENDGIIATPQDWGDAQGRPVKKTIRYSTGFEQTAYFYGATGGWNFVCQDFSATPVQTIEEFWPQIAFGHSISSDFGDACLTAAPIPGNGCFCESEGGNCNSCDSPPVGCFPNPSPTCGSGNPPKPCVVDVITGNCKGLRFQNATYQLAIPTQQFPARYSCQSNIATIGRYEKSEEPTNPLDPAPIDYSEIPPPANLSHFIPEPISQATRNLQNDLPLCCGGEGVLGVGSVDCPASSPTAPNCN